MSIGDHSPSDRYTSLSIKAIVKIEIGKKMVPTRAVPQNVLQLVIKKIIMGIFNYEIRNFGRIMGK